MSNPITVYHLDKELKVIEVYSSYKEASQKARKTILTELTDSLKRGYLYREELRKKLKL